MIELRDSEDLEVSEGGINFPSLDIARTFSVDRFDFPFPLGVHGAHRWAAEDTPELDEWCPEYKLCSESA
jgi:hypothetical protein